MSVNNEKQFREALAQIVVARNTLENIRVAQALHIEETKRDYWVVHEVEKLEEVTASIFKHLNMD